MAIPVRTETINVIKKLTKLEFDRDPITGDLRVESQYTTGYEDPNVGFVTIETGLRSFGPTQSAWMLVRKPSEGGLTNPSLSEFLTVLFDGVETGAIPLPEEPTDEPQDPD